ncbi:uncharacterized protein LOC124135273 [Haliotis rufescens]|uniref:uncharacterized protein LOC124135273 n=1 Tax=Haliotis rufescens TaxID=6454 RepID=UPI001EB02F8D|nr:uncharacterized protein LOC124135273 [Haliotis rufescens]XP_046356499.1 uncharacterized protein LOC124135273 [Haliotis rufescens]
MFLVITLLLAVGVYGQDPQHCIHSNVDSLAADNVIEKVVADADINGDHELSPLEVIIEFIGKFDANGDSMITRSEFVAKWHALYRDVPDFADYIFQHLDQTNDDFLGLFDFVPLQAIMDLDHDGKVSDVEFTIYLTHLYQDCVPFSHQDTA